MLQKMKTYFESRKQRQIARNASTIKNAKAIKEDRWGAIEYFAFTDDPAVAVPALLQRFEFSLENGITDTREKELAMEGIVKHGEAAIGLLRDHIQSTSRIAWPIKALKAITNEQTVTDVLESCLNFQSNAFDQGQVDKNYDILCYLREFKLPETAKRIAHFLTDPDERVRFAAAELLVEQNDPALAESLEPFLSDETSENRRIRSCVVEAFLKNRWRLADASRFPEGRVAPGILVNPDRQLVQTR